MRVNRDQFFKMHNTSGSNGKPHFIYIFTHKKNTSTTLEDGNLSGAYVNAGGENVTQEWILLIKLMILLKINIKRNFNFASGQT